MAWAVTGVWIGDPFLLGIGHSLPSLSCSLHLSGFRIVNSTRQEVNSFFTNLNGQKAVINELISGRVEYSVRRRLQFLVFG